MAETRLTRDGLIPLAAIATATTRPRLGTGIINVYTRNPVLLAVGFATLEEAAPGRVIIGLGTGSPRVLAQQGVEFENPLTRLREYVFVIRRLLAGERVTFAGKTIVLRDARLEVIPSRAMPIYLGVTGPRALELAGEVADGVILNGFLPIAYVRRALDRVALGTARRLSSFGELEVAMMLVTSLDEDDRRARDRIRPIVAAYLSNFPHIAKETGLDPETLKRIHELGAPAVSDEILDQLVVVGTPERCRQRLQAYRAAGVQLPIVAPIGNFAETIEALGTLGT
jgi:5,10-methylenetetrahydromethanopterin reductase